MAVCFLLGNCEPTLVAPRCLRFSSADIMRLISAYIIIIVIIIIIIIIIALNYNFVMIF